MHTEYEKMNLENLFKEPRFKVVVERLCEDYRSILKTLFNAQAIDDREREHVYYHFLTFICLGARDYMGKDMFLALMSRIADSNENQSK